MFIPVVVMYPNGKPEQLFPANVVEDETVEEWLQAVCHKDSAFASFKRQMRWPKIHEYELIPHEQYAAITCNYRVFICFDLEDAKKRFKVR